MNIDALENKDQFLRILRDTGHIFGYNTVQRNIYTDSCCSPRFQSPPYGPVSLHCLKANAHVMTAMVIAYHISGLHVLTGSRFI